MKFIIFTSILAMGLLSNASELDCSAKVSDSNNGSTFTQQIEITPTNAVDFKAEAGEILVGDLKLSVYRYISGDSLTLSVSKKHDSAITPYLDVSSRSFYNLQEGQKASLKSSVESKKIEIVCLVK